MYRNTNFLKEFEMQYNKGKQTQVVQYTYLKGMMN